MAQTNLGRVGFVSKGNWSAGTYKHLDFVRHNGATWVCGALTTTDEPAAATDWDLSINDGSSLASNINHTDAGGYFTGTDSEAIAQEIGESLGGLNTKIIDIGNWDMHTTGGDGVTSVVFAHGIDATKVRAVDVILRNDGNTQFFPITTHVNDGTSVSGHYVLNQTTGNITLTRNTGGFFDSSAFQDPAFNRGWVTIQYTD